MIRNVEQARWQLTIAMVVLLVVDVALIALLCPRWSAPAAPANSC